MPAPPLLNYRFQGNPQQPAILYLHGFLGCKEDWNETVDILGSDFTHLTIDLPGHGESAETSYNDHDFTISGCALKIIEILDHLKIEKCRLVSYSMGGRLGLFLLAHYPQRIGWAVLESASPGLADKEERKARIEHDHGLADELERGDFSDFLDRWYDQPLFASLNRSGSGFEELRRRRLTGNPEQLARSLRLMGTGVQPSLWDRITRISCPVMFAAGDQDQKFLDLARKMDRLCPTGQTAIIPEAGHSPHFEKPEEFGEAVRRFFAEHK